MLDQTRAPYFEALQDYIESGVRSFHMPGHQQGRGAPPELAQMLGLGALQADITQVLGMDDIMRPHGQCGQAQRLAAEAYGAEQTYFLVNGSSVGNQAMLMSTLKPDDVVLVARNAHASVLAGLMLSGARAAFYEVPYDQEMGVFHPPTLSDVERGLAAHPGARALFFTSPSYFGAAAAVVELVQFAHQRGLIVLVDEAWGPHLRFHPELPTSAVEAGADLVVQSTHKLASGLSQAAMLHVSGERVDRGRLESVLRMLQTTSPSCLLVASLDVARRQLATQGRELLERTLGLAQQARDRLQDLGVPCFTRRPGVHAWDGTRLVFSLVDRGWSGYQVERFLRDNHGLQLEMSDFQNGVALITLGHGPEDIERLVEGVKVLVSAGSGSLQRRRPYVRPPLPESRMSLQQAFHAEWESVAWEQAAGRICVDTLCPYPPGIAWLVPGEVLTGELIEALMAELKEGATLVGAHDPQLREVRVVKE